MAIGTTAAIIIGASAAAGAYSAHEQASAAKEAAKTQADAANKATALQHDIYGQQTQNLNPYTQAGQGAIGTLNRLLTPGGGATYASPGAGNLLSPWSAPVPGAASTPAGTPYPWPSSSPPLAAPPMPTPGAAQTMGAPRAAPMFTMPGPTRATTNMRTAGPVYDGASPLRLEDFIARA